MHRNIVLSVLFVVLLVPAVLPAADAPSAAGPLPSPRQLLWHQMEFYGFLHFTVNTFTDREWGNGDEPESIFNPTDFSADQIASVAAEAGMKGLILTAKHHDGFCLWPSKYTEHSVKNSPWKGGRGDVVREMSDACRKHGLKFGVYLSPWDRNHKDYARPAYLTYYRNQLRELLTGYGPLFEIWFDGANGGTGYYGGAREKRTIDARTYYQWPATHELIRQLQPDACIFSDAGPEVRWVGNERGIAGDPCWATLNREDFAPGKANSARLNRGDRPGTHWVPAECDVSIRPGWFYHASQDAKVKTPEQLVDLYFKSAGRGASFLLNLPPDRRGRIHESDVASLRGFRKLTDEIFRDDLAKTAQRQSGPDGQTTVVLPKPAAVNVLRIREDIRQGQRVDEFAVDAWQNNQWQEIYRGTSIGGGRLVHVAPVTTDRVRLRVLKSSAPPVIGEVAIFAAPVVEKILVPGKR